MKIWRNGAKVVGVLEGAYNNVFNKAFRRRRKTFFTGLGKNIL